jgi:hypothetical protein
VTGQLWSLCSCVIQVRLRIQLNTVLFAKTLVRKDVASSVAPMSRENSVTDCTPTSTEASSLDGEVASQVDDEDFLSKAQVMTLMTTDVDRCSEFATHMFTLVGTHAHATSELIDIVTYAFDIIDSPIEMIIGTIFLYKLLGTSEALTSTVH